MRSGRRAIRSSRIVLGRFGGGRRDEWWAKKAARLELVVSAASRPIRRRPLAALLQQGGSSLAGRALLLLVPAALGDPGRHPHRDRLLRYRRIAAAGSIMQAIDWVALTIFLLLFAVV